MKWGWKCFVTLMLMSNQKKKFIFIFPRKIDVDLNRVRETLQKCETFKKNINHVAQTHFLKTHSGRVLS